MHFRKFYYLDKEKSVGDPDKTFITVPNIPFLTGVRSFKKADGIKKFVIKNMITGLGLAKPFINISFSGLLWGYHDELPCSQISRPYECGPPVNEVNIFDEEEDYDWGDDWKRKKRSVVSFKKSAEVNNVNLRTMHHESIIKEKAAFVDCKCEWGLFRDRNGTLRKSVTINHGMNNLEKKGNHVGNCQSKAGLINQDLWTNSNNLYVSLFQDGSLCLMDLMS